MIITYVFAIYFVRTKVLLVCYLGGRVALWLVQAVPWMKHCSLRQDTYCVWVKLMLGEEGGKATL